MEYSSFAVLGVAAALAGFVQGFSGFGSTLVALPVACMVLPLRMALPVCCMLAVTINFVLATRLWGSLRLHALLLLLGSSLPGMALGAWVLGAAPENLLRSGLGVAVLVSVLRGAAARPVLTPAGQAWGALAGFTAGAMGVCLGVNGPPIAAWVHRQAWSRDAVRATLVTYFLLAGICIVSVQAWQGYVTRPVAEYFAAAVPALMAGAWAGTSLCGRVSDKTFRLVAAVLLAAVSLTLLYQAWEQTSFSSAGWFTTPS